MIEYLFQGSDYRQTEEYNRYYVRRGWRVEERDGTLFLIKNVPIIGTFIIMKRGSPATPLAAIETLAKQRGAHLIKLDYDLAMSDSAAPALVTALKSSGYLRSRLPFCPTKTIRLDLTLSYPELLARTTEDVRRYLRQNEKEAFEMRHDKTLEEFYPILRQAARANHYLVPNLANFKEHWEAFGAKLKTVLAYQNSVPLGGAMIVCGSNRASGIFMAFTQSGRKSHLPYSLMWETIRMAKDSGCREFDLDGVYDERYRAPAAWKGLSIFKKKFGGRDVEMVGSYVKGRRLPVRLMTILGLV